jgi:hypothetical protein
MNKFGNTFQWRSELLKPRMLFFSVGNGAMNAPRYWEEWELLDDACSAVETNANTLRFSYGSLNFPGLEDPNCQQLYEVALNLLRALIGWETGEPLRWTIPFLSTTVVLKLSFMVF